MSTASAPASIANLGPGFDLLALAVSMRLEVEVERSEKWLITSDGRPVAPETAAMVKTIAGEEPLAVFIRSRIPASRGLGSSAALRVATAAALAAEDGEVDVTAVLTAAAGGEGHADNAAAAVYGGLVAAMPGGSILRLAVHPSLRVVVGVPDAELSTERAREVLPTSVPREVAVRTAGRVAALVEGLRTAEPAAFEAAAGDEMHEGPRRELSPLTTRLVETAREAGALHAAWSGAGPSAVALATDVTTGDVSAALSEALGGKGSVLRLDIDRTGLEVE